MLSASGGYNSGHGIGFKLLSLFPVPQMSWKLCLGHPLFLLFWANAAIKPRTKKAALCQILTYQKAEVNHFPTASACQFHYSRLQSKRKILRRRNASDKQIHANTKFSLLSFHQLHESPQKKFNTVFIFIQFIPSTNSLLYATFRDQFEI